jgi:hypothetical protein
MSIIYCEKHDLKWDSDRREDCPSCEESEQLSFADRLALDAAEDSRLYQGQQQEVRAPGAIDQRDGFGMCAAPSEQPQPTPRTDAQDSHMVTYERDGVVIAELDTVDIDFARQLERELAEVRADALNRVRVAEMNAAAAAQSATAPLSKDYVQTVPDKCDRIVWRGNYYHLPPKSL